MKLHVYICVMQKLDLFPHLLIQKLDLFPGMNETACVHLFMQKLDLFPCKIETACLPWVHHLQAIQKRLSKTGHMFNFLLYLKW